MEIIHKTARDGHTPITISIEDFSRPTTGTTYVLVVTHNGREVAKLENARPRKMAAPIGDLTHGLIIGPDNKSVGLTAGEAQQIDTAVDAWRAENRKPVDPAAVEAAVAALHCLECGHRLSDLDIEITALEGYHPDCV